MARKFNTSVDKCTSTVAQLGTVPNLRNVVLHVLGRPATTMGDEWKLRKGETELSEEHHHLPDDRLDSLPAYHDEGGDLVADQHPIMDRDLVLNAIQPLHHLDIERTGSAPADGGRDQHDVGPED